MYCNGEYEAGYELILVMPTKIFIHQKFREARRENKICTEIMI